jgi:hypothetical protein
MSVPVEKLYMLISIYLARNLLLTSSNNMLVGQAEIDSVKYDNITSNVRIVSVFIFGFLTRS